MDNHHRAEVFLSFAMTLYGCACLLKFRYTRANALVMFALWVLQFFLRQPLPIDLPLVGRDPRIVLGWVFVGLAAVELFAHRRELDIRGALRDARALLRRGAARS
jgi:hypothetical protein